MLLRRRTKWILTGLFIYCCSFNLMAANHIGVIASKHHDAHKTTTQKELTQFGFDGQLTDAHTGRQCLGKGYRAYNPIMRRFMAQDSQSPFAKGGINGYVFANNNPIMVFDPSGHSATLNLMLMFSAAAGLAAIAASFAAGQPEIGAAVEEIAGATSKLPVAAQNILQWAGFAVASASGIAITVQQKIAQGTATTGNIILSAAVPTFAAALGTAGMLTDSAFLQAADNAIEGATYPIMQSNDVDIKHQLPEMIAGFISGGIAGQFGSYYASLAISENNSYLRSIGLFAVRGITMETSRQSSYELTRSLLRPSAEQVDFGQMGKQIGANAIVQGIEGFGIRFSLSSTVAEKNLPFDFLLGHVGFNLGGAAMQIGSPLIDSMLAKDKQSDSVRSPQLTPASPS